MLDNTVNQDHADDEIPVQPWHFTFRPGATDPNTGEDLDDRYVRIVGTYETARQQLVDWLYGHDRQIAEQFYQGESGDPADDLSLYVMPQQRATRKADTAPEPAGDDEPDVGPVALVRQLLAHAKQAGYDHATYRINTGPVEHNWRTAGGAHEVSLQEGQLTYERNGVQLLQADVDSAQQIADLLAAYDLVPIELTSSYTTGQLAASADIDAMYAGTPKSEPTDPDDYYSRLAAQLRQTADQIATLAGTPDKPWYVSLGISCNALASEADKGVPMADTIAAALGMTAAPMEWGSGMWWHRAVREQGGLEVDVRSRIPAFEDPETAQLRAEVDRLRAQLAEQAAVDDRHATPTGQPLPGHVEGTPIHGRDGGAR